MFGRDGPQSGGEKPVADTRQSVRVNVSWRARVLLSGDAFIEGRSLNVSETGVCLLLDRRFPDGAALTIALAVPEPADRSRLHPVTFSARVVFHVASGDQFRTGMVFTQIAPDALKTIRHWVVNLR